MSTHFDPRFRQTRRNTQDSRRSASEPDYEILFSRNSPGKLRWLERLLNLCARASAEVIVGTVIGVVAATPILRQLFCRILLVAALAGALLALLLTFLIISLFT